MKPICMWALAGCTLLMGRATGVAQDGGLSPVTQAEQAGLPFLGEFTLEPGGAPYVLKYRAKEAGPQRVIAAWGAKASIVLRVIPEGEREPLTVTGNPADLQFQGAAGKQYGVSVGAGDDLRVTSVGVLYGGAVGGGQQVATPAPGLGAREPVTPIPLPSPVGAAVLPGAMQTIAGTGGATHSTSVSPSGACRVFLDLRPAVIGGCQEGAFVGCIELLDYRYLLGPGQSDAQWPNAVSMGAGGGAAAERLPFSALTVLKPVDSSTPALHVRCADGKVMPKATLTVANAADLAPMFQIELAAVTIIGVRALGVEAWGAPREEVGIGFGGVLWRYLGATLAVEGQWDLLANKGK